MQRDIHPHDDYFKKLNALLPAELTGLYLFLRSLTGQDYHLYPWLGGAVVVMIVILLVFGKQILHTSKLSVTSLYCVTFVLWAASIEVYVLADMTGFQPLTFIIPALVALWSFALPPIFDKLG